MRISICQAKYCVYAYNFFMEGDGMMKVFCERLKELRLEKNLSTMTLGKILQVNQSTITRWENGAIIPSIENLYNIAVYFGVSSDYLIGLED